jgi:acetyl esterase/lipase
MAATRSARQCSFPGHRRWPGRPTLPPVFTARLSAAVRLGALLICGIMAGGGQAQWADIAVTADVVYGHKDGLAMTYDVFTPRSQANGVGLLFMVSGGWVSKWTPPEQTYGFIQPLLEKGYTVFAVRHGSSPRYVVPEVVQDVKLALAHIFQHADDFNVDPQRLGVFGFSAGGHLSLLLGTQTNHLPEGRPRIAAVAAVFPPTDLAPYVDLSSPLREQFPALKFDPSRAAEFSPLMHVTPDDAPTLLVHGDQDELVPIWHSEKMSEALKDKRVPQQLITIAGAGHGFDTDGNRRMFEGITHWFNEHLLEKPE